MPSTLDYPETSVAKESAKTRTVRLHEDLVAMLKVIEAAHELSGERFKSVEYLDKLVRKRITEDYEKARQVIAKAN